MYALWLTIYVAVLYLPELIWGECKWIKILRSPRMACWIIGLTAAGCITGGCLPADYAFQTTIPFVALLIALMTNLTLVIYHRVHSFNIKKDWAFLATHFGIWLALFSGMAGADKAKQLRSVINSEVETAEAIDTDGHLMRLPYSLRLKDFRIDKNAADGSPVQYSATVLINGSPIDIAVNSPYSVNMTEDIYLMSFDIEGEAAICLLTIERQPWKYPMLAGICLLLTGSLFIGLKRLR